MHLGLLSIYSKDKHSASKFLLIPLGRTATFLGRLLKPTGNLKNGKNRIPLLLFFFSMKTTNIFAIEILRFFSIGHLFLLLCLLKFNRV